MLSRSDRGECMMKTEKISLTRALVELKMLDKRIYSKSSSFEPVTTSCGGTLPKGIKSEVEFKKSVKAQFQSLKDLMARRSRIKSALVKANASTTIKVADKKMTIAEAIERKSSISQEKELLRFLKAKYTDAHATIEKGNAEMKSQLLKLLEATYAKSETEISKDDYDKVAIPFKENNETKLIDPIGLKAVMEEMEQSIESFETEVDVVLSEANARTMIEV